MRTRQATAVMIAAATATALTAGIGRAGVPVHPDWSNALRPTDEPGPELHLAEDGEPLYRIVMPRGAEGHEKLAAEKLQEYLGRMTGADFALVEEDGGGQATGREISVGRTRLLVEADPPDLRADLGEDGYAVAVKDGRLFVFGETPRGTLNGVYCLLEEDLGCRWYSKLFEPMIPKRPSLRFRPAARAYRPVLDHQREVYYSDAKGDAEWSRANRQKPYGGHAWGFCHSYDRLVPPGKYFKDHPEYYSEIDGKRTPRQLCLTNPGVENIILEQILDHAGRHPGQRTHYEISPNDGRGYCQCAECRAVNEAAGGTEMGTLLALINRIAAKLETDHPEDRITTLAYLETVQPPVNEKPRRNVIITLCTDRSTWAWPHLYVTETPTLAGTGRTVFRDSLQAWHKAGANIRIWDYTIVFQYTLKPLPNMPVVSDNMRYYVRHGATGVFLQGYHNASDGCDRSLMRSWVWAKQLWDPSLDTRELVRDFNYGFYGPAGAPMQAYDELLWRLWGRHHMNFLQNGDNKMRYDLLYTREFLDEARALVAEAESLAGGNQDLLRRIRLAKLPLQYLALNRGPEGDPAGYRRMLDEFKQTTQASASCWSHPWVGTAGCGPGGDTGGPNEDHDHVPLATHTWQGVGRSTDLALTGHDGFSLKDLVDQWSGPRDANAGIIIKSDPASEASRGNRFAWAASEREPAWLRPKLTIDYMPVDGAGIQRIVFQQGADNILVTGYQGCEDNLLVATDGNANRGRYHTNGVGSFPWSNKNNPARSVMRWDLSALAGRYADVRAVTLTFHNDSAHGTGTAYVYAIKPANAGWVEGGIGQNIGYLENNLASPPDRDRIVALWEQLASGGPLEKADGVAAVEIGPTWRFRYDTTGTGEEREWHEPGTDDDDWTEIEPGSSLHRDERGHAWLRTRLGVPKRFPRNLNNILYVPGVRGDVVLYINGRKGRDESGLGFERTALATGLRPAELEALPLDVTVFRGMSPGDEAAVAIRMACPQGVNATWKPAYLVSVPVRLTGPALDQVVNGLKARGLVQSGEPRPPAPILGRLSLPDKWTVFGPLNRSDPMPAGDVLRSVPAHLTIGDETLHAKTRTAENHRLDLVDMLGASPGRTAYVFIPFELDAEQDVTLGLGADWWFESWVDGVPLMDTLEYGNVNWPPGPTDYMRTLRLGKGSHVLVVRFLSGSGSSLLAVAGPDDLRE